ncbi:MAG: short-chain fatty acid transporter [Gammaproteobacteria bacterium]|jgi:short-chain fatty acids transporter|uniref:short-chain fatty acid transporter n=1 Tax=Marinomonas sp. BSi20584 TaxID=1594462 RepID=UPI000C1F274F|nr:short-chain fatty acid transporter [Marinomonas sp. BSi20584]MBU1465877.1 short-chain fatty acid transporter [Gammaproteobacteria bacterium]MBU2020988.1 short-chain fatty acid transporter [Gammaproteobacteria bacterium]MBU2317726.1 short-chain fatty acid transporter [Gammaproteobacteria bacterium]MBU2414493.1 short-chain fatty acid transporter [Gammaproteobacteria bacterium]PJE54804.1 short-chain fatty acid transporter [Marinomonas sp. BSi20584]
MNTLEQKQTGLQKVSQFFVTLLQRYLPDPFIFAIVLTFAVFLLVMPSTGQGPMQVVNAWAGGFWNLLSFSMQMAMVVVTGHAMASAPAFKRKLAMLAGVAKTPGQAIILVTVISAMACWVNWGFGLVVGAIFAKEIAARVKGVDYRLLIASAYSGFLFWHGGLSGSIPLSIAGGANISKVTNGAVTGPIPTSETIFSTMNLTILAVMFITIPLLNRLMHPAPQDTVTIDAELLKEQVVDTPNKADMSPAERLENSRVLSLLLGVMGFAYIIYYFVNNGFALNLNVVNFTFLFSAVLLHGTPKSLLSSVSQGARNCSGILLQFPFYAGIMGMMTATGDSGASLAGVISQAFVSISNETTFPLFTFLSAGIVNFFVPSGGGQWAVQAPIMMPAGAALGVDAAKTAMAIAWGDAWTNMIQPFWALPALAIAGLGAKDVMGYCLMALIGSGVIISLGFLIF